MASVRQAPHPLGFTAEASFRRAARLTPPQQAPPQSRPYTGTYLPNGGVTSGPVPGATPLLPNQGRVIQQGSTRVLCIADVRGKIPIRCLHL